MRQPMNGPYDTKLDTNQEFAFQTWGAKQAQKMPNGYNPANDTNDYDMRGWFKENGPQDLTAGAHFVDKYKKPNHPTFSTDSQYSGKYGNEGGNWQQTKVGPTGQEGWSFTPGKTNLQFRSTDQLKKYFKDTEGPLTHLNVPDSGTILQGN